MDAKVTVLNVFVEYGLPVLATLLLLLTKFGLGMWIKHRMEDHKDSKASALFNKFLSIMQMVVLDVEKSLKPELEAACKDGILTKDEWVKMRTVALERFWVYVGDQGKKDLGSVLGIVAPDVEKLVGSMLESAVARIPTMTGKSTVEHDGYIASETLSDTAKTAVTTPPAGVSPRP